MPFIGVQPATVPLTSSDITDGIISTAKIADDAVTGAKIENNPTIAGTLNASAGLTTPSGHVIQLVNTSSSSSISTSSTSAADTGITLDITPKFSSSKLWMIFSARTYINTSGAEYIIQIKDGSTTVGGGASLYNGAGTVAEACTFQTFVSPNTTSTKTYKITHYVSTGTGFISVQNATDFAMNFTIVEVSQ